MDGEKSDNDIALTIGQICIDNPGAAEDLKSVLTKDNCRSGMMEYLKLYDGGKLPSLAGKIGDGGSILISSSTNSVLMQQIGCGTRILLMQRLMN